MMFFEQFVDKVFGPHKAVFSFDDVRHAWTAGQMSVLEFKKAGGSLLQLEDALVGQAIMHEKSIKSGMAEQMLERIKKQKERIKNDR